MQARGCWFDTWLFLCHAETIGKLFALICHCLSSVINSYWLRNWKTTTRLMVAAYY